MMQQEANRKRNGINRIRLEFKGYGKTGNRISESHVLIESDWNLKIIDWTDEEVWELY